MTMSKTECKRILRTLELKAYRSVVDALRAQGTFTNNKHEVLKNLAATLSISEERYRSEMRRACNDDLLNNIAQCITGKNTDEEWRTESKKKVPLTPMVASQTAFTALADTISDIIALENEKFSDSAELKNVLESYKCRGQKNLEKYTSSKAFDSLLQKRKNHHQDAILLELEKIKTNNNYPPSPAKQGFIEISYDEQSSSRETPVLNSRQKTVSWKSDDEVYTIEDNDISPKSAGSKLPKRINTKSPAKSNITEIENESQPERKNTKEKFTSKKKIVQKPIHEETIFQNNSRTRNLRAKPFKKYTINSVEIRSFVDEELPEEPRKSKTVRGKSTNDAGKNIEKVNKSTNDSKNTEKLHKSTNDVGKKTEKAFITESKSDEHFEISHHERNTKSKGKASKRKGKVRTKPARSSKLTKVRKLATVQRTKSDTVKETPMRISRISMRNARRRNYARMASGDYDISEFRRVKKEKKIEPEPEPEPEPKPEPKVEEAENETSEEEEEDEEMKESDPETFSDSSNAPIEVSYSSPMPPKNANYDLEVIPANFSEDDMKPHTFNLIPASRRLKMLKKRTMSPPNDEIPAKKLAPSPSKNERTPIISQASTNDINALRKVLAAHENMGSVATCNLNDLPQNVQELLDIPEQSQLSSNSRDSTAIKETPASIPIAPLPITSTPIPARNVPEKRPAKPKMKLSEASTIENLHSLLSKMKEGDLKRLSRDTGKDKKPSASRKLPRNKVTKKIPTRLPSPIQTKHNGTLIEVNNLEHGSDSSFSNDNYDASSKGSDSEDQIVIENSDPLNFAPKPIHQVLETSSASDAEVVSILLDDVDGVTKCEVSEQLIDIESADIIIGDQNSGFIMTPVSPTDPTIITTEPSDQTETKTYETLKLLDPTAISISNEAESAKNEFIIINVDKNEDEQLEKFLNSFDSTINNSKAKSNNHAKPPTSVKEMLSAASDFRYTADSDDPALKKQPAPLIPKNSFIVPKPPAPVKHSTIKTIAPIKINNLESTTNVQKPTFSAEIINNSTKSNDRQFVLLDTRQNTSATAGSKSLLKSMKTLPKISPAINSTVNNTLQKPKKLAIYSSLQNINMTTISSLTKNIPVKTTNVTTLLKNNDSVSTHVNTKTNTTTVNSDSLKEKDLEKVALSQVLEETVAFMKTLDDTEEAVVEMEPMQEKLESSKNFEKMIEISSDSPSDDSISTKNDNESSISDGNGLKTFFSKNIIKKQT